MRALTLLLVLLVPLTASAQITFERTYGGPWKDKGYSVTQTDGGYVIAGHTYSFGPGGSAVYLIRTDAWGDTLWTRTYGGSGHDCGYSVEQTNDGGYVIGGYTSSFGAGSYDTYLIKIDATGDTVWTRTYGGSGEEYGESVKQTGDGGYVIAGHTASFGAGNDDVYLIKTDAIGDTVWTRTYGGSGREYGVSVEQTGDGGYVIAGHTDSFGAGSYDVYLISTDASGDTVWTRTYGGSDDDYGYSVEQTGDGGYIIAGYSASFALNNELVYLIRTDAWGDTLWTRTYGGLGEDYGYSVEQTGDGGYVIAGYTESFGGDGEVYLIRTDAWGDTLWTRTYGGSYVDEGFSVGQTTDGGYIIAGSNESVLTGNIEVYLIKTDADGYVQIGGDTYEMPRPEYQYLAQNHPNPFGSVTTIAYSLAGPTKVRVAVYDIRGARVRELASGAVSAGSHRVVWDGRDWGGKAVGSGIYFCHLEADEFTETRRMVLLR